MNIAYKAVIYDTSYCPGTYRSCITSSGPLARDYEIGKWSKMRNGLPFIAFDTLDNSILSDERESYLKIEYQGTFSKISRLLDAFRCPKDENEFKMKRVLSFWFNNEWNKPFIDYGEFSKVPEGTIGIWGKIKPISAIHVPRNDYKSGLPRQVVLEKWLKENRHKL